MGLEAKVKPRRSATSILNVAVATFKEAPLPVKLVIGGTVGVAGVTILSGCTVQSNPCEVLPTDTPDQKGGVCPLTIYSYPPEKVLSPEDQAAYRLKYGADIKTIYQWIAVDKGSNSESVGDGTVAFSTYGFENGKTMVVFPSANEDYNSGKSEAHEYESSLFETADGKILQSYNYRDELNPEKTISFLTIEYKKPAGVTLEDISKNPSKLGSPDKITVSNPPAHEAITYNVDSNNPDDKNLLDAIASLGVGVVHALGEGTATPPPTEAPTAIPTPMPVEVAPGEFIPTSQIVGYEARDVNGKLIYVQDTKGVWIKAAYEVTVAPATQEDWTNVNARLGTDFVINTDGTITGVEGLNINMTNGEATFNFDGKGTEVYHIGNIKVQEIDGVKTLLVAGYSWNPESKSWEVFNPGFPMESPEAQLGWFMEADVANGNWLRWHQRATEDIDMKALFAKAVRPNNWIIMNRLSDKKMDYTLDGIKDVLHFGAIWWQSPKLEEAWAKGESGFLTKEQFPNRTCESSAFLTDMNVALFSNDMLNTDGSITSLPSAIDVEWIWGENAKFHDVFGTLAEGCNVDQSILAAAGFEKPAGLNFTIWPVMASYPDEDIMMWLTEENGQFLKDPAGIERRTQQVDGKIVIDPSASLDLWGAKIIPVGSLQYWRIE